MARVTDKLLVEFMEHVTALRDTPMPGSQVERLYMIREPAMRDPAVRNEWVEIGGFTRYLDDPSYPSHDKRPAKQFLLAAQRWDIPPPGSVIDWDAELQGVQRQARTTKNRSRAPFNVDELRRSKEGVTFLHFCRYLWTLFEAQYNGNASPEYQMAAWLETCALVGLRDGDDAKMVGIVTRLAHRVGRRMKRLAGMKSEERTELVNDSVGRFFTDPPDLLSFDRGRPLLEHWRSMKTTLRNCIHETRDLPAHRRLGEIPARTFWHYKKHEIQLPTLPKVADDLSVNDDPKHRVDLLPPALGEWLTQEQFAIEARCCVRTVRRYERDPRNSFGRLPRPGYKQMFFHRSQISEFRELRKQYRCRRVGREQRGEKPTE